MRRVATDLIATAAGLSLIASVALAQAPDAAGPSRPATAPNPVPTIRILPGPSTSPGPAVPPSSGAASLPPAPHAVVTTRIVGTAVNTQSAVLFDNEPSKTFHAGTVAWHADTASRLDPTVRGDIDIPGWLSATLTVRRNTDEHLAATHVIDVAFTPSGMPHADIATVAGFFMKEATQPRGEPLTGRPVTTAANHIVFGLSPFPDDAQRNAMLLHDRAWFQIPIVYQDGHRSVLMVLKGIAGQRIFNDAFAEWKKADFESGQ